MSDWTMYDVEDIVWDEFGRSDDHIVPHTGGTTVSNFVQLKNCCIKPQGEEASSLGKGTDIRFSVLKSVSVGKEGNAFLSSLEDRNTPMLEKGSLSHACDDVFPTSCNSDYINVANALAPDDGKISSSCFKNDNIGSLGREFCADDPILGNGPVAVDKNLSNFQLDDISAAESDLFFGNRHDSRERSDLLDYRWADIGNFEDVDKMFRNCDSTFGQSDTCTIDRLSWFSTSHTNDLYEDTSKSRIQSSSSEREAFNNAQEHQEANPILISAIDHLPVIDSDKKKCFSTSNQGFLNSDANGCCTYVDRYNVNTKRKGESSSVNQENAQSKSSKSQDLPKGKRNVQSSVYWNGNIHGSSPIKSADLKLPSSVPSSAQIHSQQRQNAKANSSRYQNACVPYGQDEYKHPHNQYPVSPSVLSIKSDTKSHSLSFEVGYTSNNFSSLDISPNHPSKLSEGNVNVRQRPHQFQIGTLKKHQQNQFICNSAITNQAPLHKQVYHNQNNGNSEVKEIGIDFTATEKESTAQESSCMSSVFSHEASLEAISFWQLQDAMEQLDIRTKLCIRDSLYRLARSAEQRHKTNNNSRESRGSAATATEELRKCLGRIDPETDTNPIDRSIAHLLFYRPPGPSMRHSFS